MEDKEKVVVAEEAEKKIDDFNAPECAVDDTAVKNSKNKTYAIYAFAAIILVGLLAGIMMRADGVLDKVVLLHNSVKKDLEATMESNNKIQALLAKTNAAFVALDAKVTKDIAAGDESRAALTEIRSLYKETTAALRETLSAKDHLLNEVIMNLRGTQLPPAPQATPAPAAKPASAPQAQAAKSAPAPVKK